MIKGGYILQPRIIQESDISVAPPYVREIWNYLLREANYQEIKYNGHVVKRGQLFRSYEDIREGTKWFVGWRKCTYNENHTKKAMKFLRETQRIVTTKELGGVLITICNYDYYQDWKNYERTTNGPIDRTIAEPLRNQPIPDNNNEGNNNNERKEEKIGDVSEILILKNLPELIVELFEEIHGNYKTMDYDKEKIAALKIITLFQEKYPQSSDEEIINGLKPYFEKCITIKDDWLRSRMSLPNIVKYFNEINNTLKHGKGKQKSGSPVENDDLRDIVIKRSGNVNS
jgi:hypothetical protein